MKRSDLCEKTDSEKKYLEKIDSLCKLDCVELSALKKELSKHGITVSHTGRGEAYSLIYQDIQVGTARKDLRIYYDVIMWSDIILPLRNNLLLSKNHTILSHVSCLEAEGCLVQRCVRIDKQNQKSWRLCLDHNVVGFMEIKPNGKEFWFIGPCDFFDCYALSRIQLTVQNMNNYRKKDIQDERIKQEELLNKLQDMLRTTKGKKILHDIVNDFRKKAQYTADWAEFRKQIEAWADEK